MLIKVLQFRQALAANGGCQVIRVSLIGMLVCTSVCSCGAEPGDVNASSFAAVQGYQQCYVWGFDYDAPGNCTTSEIAFMICNNSGWCNTGNCNYFAGSTCDDLAQVVRAGCVNPYKATCRCACSEWIP